MLLQNGFQFLLFLFYFLNQLTRQLTNQLTNSEIRIFLDFTNISDILLTKIMTANGPIAQLAEQPAHNRSVPGSNPGGPTKKLLLLILSIVQVVWNL